MEQVKNEDQTVVKPKPKLHIWNQILEDDELSEKLAASMNKLGDEFAHRFIRKKKNKKNKKKKKGKKDLNTNNNTNGNDKANGTPIQVKISKPEVKKQDFGQFQPQHSDQNRNRPIGGFSQKSKRKSKLPDNILQSEANNISKKLKEKRIDLIIRTIRHLGLDEAMKLCSEVLTIEEAGGLMTLNGVRRRTPGGIFFHLIRSSGRYEASIVSKIFKEGEGKEPLFKSRNKSRHTSAIAKNANGLSMTNDKSCIINCAPNTTVQVTLPIASVSTIAPIVPIVSTTPITWSAQPIEQEQSTQSINSTNPVPSNNGINPDMKMNEDEDDYENSNLVIVEYGLAKMENTNINPSSGQLIKRTFLNNSNSPDLNILYQHESTSTVTSETPSMINSNVPIFTTNRISVNA